ncbi:unnamed protein product [Tuber aestivum]|uniref:Uncharacterized protein n=1 Tax=Tuber aestivum TaxID=59557 RepID=A0A292Q5T8_9PEZI|nr:unnamed protein product [Tuber aestivum]
MGIVTDMNWFLQTKIPQRIAKPQRLGSRCGAAPGGRGQVKWAAAGTVSNDPRVHGLGRSLLGEFSTVRRSRETQGSVLRVDKAGGGPGRFAFEDPRERQLGRTLSDEFAVIREKYRFDELRLAGNYLPGIHYWRGITEAFRANDIGVILTSGLVPPTQIVWVLADDCGFSSAGIRIHRSQSSSTCGMYSVESEGTNPREEKRTPRVYKALETIGMQAGAFSQLTTEYMILLIWCHDSAFTFINVPSTPSNHIGERRAKRRLGDIPLPHVGFRFLSDHLTGLVSVSSAQWGVYKGTLVGPSHLDLINWTNRLKWIILEAVGKRNQFNAIAFYLDIAGAYRTNPQAEGLTLFYTGNAKRAFIGHVGWRGPVAEESLEVKTHQATRSAWGALPERGRSADIRNKRSWTSWRFTCSLD